MTESDARRRMRDDFPCYARLALKIRTKDGAVAPFVLNRAQEYLHERFEAQRRLTGKVRAVVLKGRQQGCSTYVEGRLFWRATHRRGVRAFILTHEDAATANLFEMAERFYEHCPAAVRPSAGRVNARELHFDRLDSGYRVGTANTKGTGRSSTIQYFHGSEVAFWANARTHVAGVLQAVPDAAGTEVVLESTANGVGNFFHQAWQDAEEGKSGYEAVFVPWFWQPEYWREPEPGFEPDAEEREYMAAYGLDLGQIAWRRAKIAEFRDPLLFRQEYPATAAEAFQVTGRESFVRAGSVVRARKARVEGVGAHVAGCDPAKGGDRTAIVHRRGRRAWGLETSLTPNTMHVVGRCRELLDSPEDPVATLFLDVGGLGGPIYDRLVEMGYGDRVAPVNFGSRADVMRPERYRNKRAEMWGELRDWLEAPEGCEVPDSDELQADLCGPGYSYDSEQRIILEGKEDLARRGVRSPDAADALALTFARPVAGKAPRPRRDAGLASTRLV